MAEFGLLEGNESAIRPSDREPILQSVEELLDTLHYFQNSQETRDSLCMKKQGLFELDGLITSWISETLNSKAVFENIENKATQLVAGKGNQNTLHDATLTNQKILILKQVIFNHPFF